MSTTTENSARQAQWVLAASDQGTFILNRNDVAQYNNRIFGVGYELLTYNAYGRDIPTLLEQALRVKRKQHGQVLALDLGANIGVFTVHMARYMTGWGSVVAFEPQERIFYALCGNIALNNCGNATARFSAVGTRNGEIAIPVPDYGKNASFGSLSLAKDSKNEDFGQELTAPKIAVPIVSVDKLAIGRIDFIKIDVEGMEAEVLNGAIQTLYRHRPILFLEHEKSHPAQLRQILDKVGYFPIEYGANWLAAHVEDVPLLGVV